MKLKFILSLLVLLLISCSKEKEKKPAVTSKDELYVYLDSLENEYENACTAIQRARFNMLMKDVSQGIDQPSAKLASLLLDTSAFKIIVEWRGRASSLADKLLARRLDLWYRLFLGGKLQFDPEILQAENKLHQEISKTKYAFNGTPFSASEILWKLQNEKNSKKRKKIWQAIVEQNKTFNSRLIDLITLRNKKSETLGFNNYYSMVLYLQAIDEKWLLKTINSIEELTHAESDKILNTMRKKFHLKKLNPWDVEFVTNDLPTLPKKYFSHDSVIQIVHRFEKGIGFVIDSLKIKEEFSPDVPTAVCSVIKIPDEIQISLPPKVDGINFYESVFREYGYALHGKMTNVKYPILKGYRIVLGSNNTAFENGIANFNALCLTDSLWLSKFTKLKGKEFQQYVLKRNMYEILKIRKSVKQFFTEYELYKTPEINIDSLERKLLKNIFNIEYEETAQLPFESIDQFIKNPFSSQNYVLSAMIAAQVYEAMESKFGNDRFSDSSVASWITESLYSTGETTEWFERIRNATGKYVEPGAMLRKLGIEHMKVSAQKSEK